MEHFVFKKEWREALKGYSAEVRAEVYEAVLAYAFEGEVLPMSELAKMAFNFIKLSIDAMQEAYSKQCERNREKANKRWGKNAEQCQDMPSDAEQCQGTPSDAINSNQINSNQNNISLSFDEREKIFEIFYFERNLATATEEYKRFCQYYEANGWCRNNSDKPVKNKVALAKAWRVENDKKRFPDNIRRWLHSVYRKLKEQNKNASCIFEVEGVIIEQGQVIIKCTRQVAELIESVATSIPRDFDKLAYRVKRTA